MKAVGRQAAEGGEWLRFKDCGLVVAWAGKAGSSGKSRELLANTTGVSNR